MIFDSVDLPAPLAPSRPCTSPARSSKPAPSSACLRSNALRMPVAASSGAAGSAVIADAVSGRVTRPGPDVPGPAGASFHLVGEHRLLHRREHLGDVLAGDDEDRHEDLLLGRAAVEMLDQGLGGLLP